MKYLYIIQQAMVWILTIYWLYQLIISLCSFVKIKEKDIVDEKNNKFMAIVPAHNEEHVIGNLIDSLKNQTYSSELVDIYVIADNCTDNTVQIAKDAGAIVIERREENKEKQTKGAALQWFLAQKIKENADYDAFCVFDADNIVDKNFFTAMNKKLCQGEEVVQGYRDIKNPSDSWVSAGYAIFYWTMHRFYHLARYNLGLSALLNGTGFMVKFDLIKPTGWDTKTLTEDIEFSLKTIIQGRRVGWAVDAIVYDEQPVGFKQSWSQRSRWTIGHMQCLHEYTGDLAVALKEKKTLLNFDGLLYMVGSIPMFVMTALLLILNFIMYGAGGMTTADLLINCLKYILPTFFLPIFTGIAIMIIDKKPIRPMIKGLALYPLFLGSWILINVKCLFVRNTNWEKIEHVRDIKIKDVA